MADSLITISDPVATIVNAATHAYEITMNYSAKVRETESQASRDMEDRIRFQSYWDLRAVLQWAQIVGEPMPWPPKVTP